MAVAKQVSSMPVPFRPDKWITHSHDGDWITPRVAAQKYLMLKVRRIEQMCRERVFPSAHKPGKGPNAHWRILRSDVINHRMNNHLNYD